MGGEKTECLLSFSLTSWKIYLHSDSLNSSSVLMWSLIRRVLSWMFNISAGYARSPETLAVIRRHYIHHRWVSSANKFSHKNKPAAVLSSWLWWREWMNERILYVGDIIGLTHAVSPLHMEALLTQRQQMQSVFFWFWMQQLVQRYKIQDIQWCFFVFFYVWSTKQIIRNTQHCNEVLLQWCSL